MGIVRHQYSGMVALVHKKVLVDLVIACLIACVSTWPITMDYTVNLSRHFDVFGLLWLSEGVQSMDDGAFTNINFPWSTPIGHIDSWLWFGLLWITQNLSPSPHFTIAVSLTGSIALNIWLAKVCASTWGMKELPSWMVGALFGLSGSMLTTILEGGWYLSSRFWLPLTALALYKHQRQTHQWWLLVTITSWTGALLTSAYLGMATSILVIILVLYLQPRRRSNRWVAQILVPIGTIGIVYTAYFLSVQGVRFEDASGNIENWTTMGSTTLWNYLLWNPDLDQYGHSLGPVGNVFVLFALLTSPWMKLPSSWRVWWIMGWIGIVLSVGFQLSLVDEEIGIPWILQLILHRDWVSFIHFPVRFHWLTDLSGAMLFALLISSKLNALWMHRTLLLLICINQFIIQGWFDRMGDKPLPTISAYSHASQTGALFELYPVFTRHSNVEPLYIKNLLCLQQLVHHRPLLISCMGTETEGSVDWQVRGLFFSDALSDGKNTNSKQDWTELLPKLGIGTLVFHSDWFETSDRVLLNETLETWFGQPSYNDDDGILIWTFENPESNRERLQQRYMKTFPTTDWPK